MLKLEDLLREKGKSQTLLSRAQDASQFIRYYRYGIESSPLEVYSSGLIFSPTQSITRVYYHKEKSDWILNLLVVGESWNSRLQTVEGHSDWVWSIIWSPDGSRLASASDDATVRIWDPVTGQCTSILEGHTSSVDSIAWSPDGNRLASASWDKTVRIWDPATGQCTSILEGHSRVVRSIAWSPDKSRLASVSDDETVRIWDPATGQCTSTFEGHSDSVRSIVWSPDGSRLASASLDKTVRIWNSATGQCVSTLEGHSESVMSTAWSPDGRRLASASDNTIRIWDPATDQCTSTFDIHSPHILQFNNTTPNNLHTNVGTLDPGFTDSVTSSPHFLTIPRIYGYGLSNDSSWITYNGFNVLWLPAEYRPSDAPVFAISATTVAIGCSSGRVIFIALSENNTLSMVGKAFTSF